MSRVAAGDFDQIAATLRIRLDAGLRQISFMVVPSAAAFLVIGDVIVALLFQSGRFTHADAIYVWAVLAGTSVGLLATTMGRLYNSAFYALYDTRTPLKIAAVRFTLTLVLGYLCAIPLPPMIGMAERWGVAGLTASAGVAGWVEFTLLRYSLNRRIGRTGLPSSYIIRLWLYALIAAAAGFAIKLALAGHGPRIVAMGVIPVYGAVYFGLAWWARIAELDQFAGFLMRRLRGGARRNPS
jgi:putative peptidoglycan lipid II flippase